MADAPRITPRELNERMKADGDLAVVDVRRGSWNESDVKIKGALRIDPERLEQEYTRIPAGSRVVTYCT